MIFVDTGAFVAKYIRRDQHYANARPIWERIERKNEQLCTSNFVIDELATLLARGSNYSFAAQKIGLLYESGAVKILRPVEEDERLALQFFAKYADQEVSFTDCISFALMQAHRLTRVFCFDRHFDLPGFTRIPPGFQI
ncbi:MAG TPA: PIN domain-containing protein [Thermoanaerobaculia bacterium]|nr:PIN domain-containing protein [Thermoanaerobaculia bacterium]